MGRDDKGEGIAALWADLSSFVGSRHTCRGSSRYQANRGNDNSPEHTGSLPLGDWVARIAAGEAVIGLFIELILIATFSKRFLGN